MYKGILNSIFENPFRYDIKSKELPFGFMQKIKNEAYVLSDYGVRKILVELHCLDELIFLKTSKASLTYIIDKLKVKVTLINVKINKVEDSSYLLTFESILFT